MLRVPKIALRLYSLVVSTSTQDEGDEKSIFFGYSVRGRKEELAS